MAQAPRGSGMIPRRPPAQGPSTLINFHNQAVSRADYSGPRGSGFTVEFLGVKAAKELDDALTQGALAVRASSIAAVVSSTDELKQKMRSYLDGHFTGSDMHGNNHRKVSNAAVQSATYDEVSDKGQYATLIYSKFGFRGAGGFVDFLLLHMRGGTIRPTKGQWLRLPNPDEPAMLGAQTGKYGRTGSEIFFVPSKDGKKLFQLQRFGGWAAGKRSGQTRLLATLLKSLTFTPSLQGLEAIMATHGATFERNFAIEWRARTGENA